MEDQIEPWFGLLGALGVAAVVGAWFLARAASERARAAVAAFGAAMLVMSFSSLLGSAGRIALLVSGDVYGAPQQWLHVLLLVGGLALGAGVVGYARRRADEAGEDLAADAVVAAGFDDDPDDADDPYTTTRRRLVTAAPSLDVVALAVALALPLASTRIGYGFPGSGGDITFARALIHVLTGITGAAALLALVRRPDTSDRVVVGGFALIALCVIAVPVWPGPFSNELWGAFAAGLSAGLAAAVGLRLIADAVPGDRSLATAGALAAVVLIVLSAWVSSVALSQQINAGPDGIVGELLDDYVPEDLPNDFPADFPTDLPTP